MADPHAVGIGMVISAQICWDQGFETLGGKQTMNNDTKTDKKEKPEWHPMQDVSKEWQGRIAWSMATADKHAGQWREPK